jgi:acyl-CoA thioesterase
VPGLWTDLLACLQLRVQDGAEFEGDSQRLNYHRVFGGQLLGQFIRAASATCPDKTVKSLHAVFAKEGRADDPVRYQVTRHHEGRSFRTDRWLLLRQHSPVLAHGRCFGRGDVLTEDGSLVASYAQEALLRFRDAGDPCRRLSVRISHKNMTSGELYS